MIKLLRIASHINMVTAICLCSGCTTEPHCPEVVTYKYDLSDAQKKLMKYTAKDTITFITNAGDTSVLLVDSIFDSYEEYEGSGNDPSCPQPINAYQVQNFLFRLTSGNLQFKIKFYVLMDPKVDYIPSTNRQPDCVKVLFDKSFFYLGIRFFNNSISNHFLSEKSFFNNSKYTNVTYILSRWGELAGDTLFFDQTYKVIGARIGNIEYVLLE